VIPTVGTVFGFLLLVMPGLLYEQVYERRRPRLKVSPFREASTVALVSVAIHLVVGASVLVIGNAIVTPPPPPSLRIQPPPDPAVHLDQWLVGGTRYAAAHIEQLFWFGLVELSIAAAVAVAAALVVTRGDRSARLHRGPLWFRAFRQEAPPGSTVFVRATLESGEQYWGNVAHYTAEDVPMEERELELAGPLLVRLPGEVDARNLPAAVSRVLLPGSAIRGIDVMYLQPSPERQ
jgi:hypothetical protein